MIRRRSPTAPNPTTDSISGSGLALAQEQPGWRAFGKLRKLKPRLNLLQHPQLHTVGIEVSLQFVFALSDLPRRIGTQPDVFIVAGGLGIQREVTHAQVARQIRE